MENRELSKSLGLEIIQVLSKHDININEDIFEDIVNIIESTVEKQDKISKKTLFKLIACSTCIGKVANEVIDIVQEME